MMMIIIIHGYLLTEMYACMYVSMYVTDDSRRSKRAEL